MKTRKICYGCNKIKHPEDFYGAEGSKNSLCIFCFEVYENEALLESLNDEICEN